MFNFYKNDIVFLGIFFISILFSSTLVAQKSVNTTTSDDSWIELVKDIIPGYLSSEPQKIFNFNGTAFFVARTSSGFGLWKSDGSDAGTQLIVDLDEPDIDLNYEEFTVFNNRLFFRAAGTQSGLGSELWSTDGTAAGTHIVKDIATTVDVFNRAENSSPDGFTVIGNVMYFAAWTKEYGRELWRTDGTEIGTWMVEDMHTAEGWGSHPSSLANINGTLFFFSSFPIFCAGQYRYWI